MANINVYVVVNLTINDADEYRIYEKGFFPILKKHNGSFITFDDSPECLEGEQPTQFDRVIIFSFPSEQEKVLMLSYLFVLLVPIIQPYDYKIPNNGRENILESPPW